MINKNFIVPEDWENRPVKENTARYEKVICKAVGLLHPDTVLANPQFKNVHIGTFTATSSPEVLNNIIRFRIKQIRQKLKQWETEEPDLFKSAYKTIGGRSDVTIVTGKTKGKDFSGQSFSYDNETLIGIDLDHTTPFREYFAEEHLIVTFEQYQKIIKSGGVNVKTEVKKLDTKNLGGKVTEIDGFTEITIKHIKSEEKRLNDVIEANGIEQYTPDLDGYLKYLNDIGENGLVNLLTRPIPYYLKQDQIHQHSYITAGTGSGKSELLKLLIYSQIQDKKGAVVVIDPHGTMATQIAHWPEFANNNRLVYIDPVLSPEHIPTINPFIAKQGVLPHVQAQQIVNTFENMLQGDGGMITGNMINLLDHCIQALILMENKDTGDLLRFMSDRSNKNMDLIEQAKTLLNEFEAEFFEHDFNQTGYKSSKEAVTRKVRRILSGIAHKLFTGASTFDLESLINQKKVIVFNLAKGSLGDDASEAFGRFVTSTIEGMAMRREKIPENERVPVHVVIDECQNYLSSSIIEIMTGTRKYKTYLTLCQQVSGHGMNSDMFKAVRSCATIKIAGMNDDLSTLKEYSNATNTPIDIAKDLKKREFLIRTDKSNPVTLLQPASYLVDFDNHTMTPEEWEALTLKQLEKYYKPIGAPEDTPEPKAQQTEANKAPKAKYELDI